MRSTKLIVFCFLFSLGTGQKAFCPGLVNQGDDCFLNTAMQFFYNLKPFNNYLRDLKKNYILAKNTLPDQYLTEIEGMKNTKPPATYNLTGFRAILSKEDSQVLKSLATGQQDAQEMTIGLLQYFYSSAQEGGLDFTKIIQHKDGTPINVTESQKIKADLFNIFNGQYLWETTCDQCKTSYQNLEYFSDLRMNFFIDDEPVNDQASFTLEQLFRKYFSQVNQLSDVDCDVCNKKQSKKKTVKISTSKSIPQVLLIVLRRFMSKIHKNPFRVEYKKLFNKVTFPIAHLNLKPYTQPQLDILYDLTSILIHSGDINTTTGQSSGHYYGYYKDPESGKWFYTNDGQFKEVSQSEIQDIADQKTEIGGPYILVYQIQSKAQLTPLAPENLLPQKLEKLKSSLEKLKSKLATLKDRLKNLSEILQKESPVNHDILNLRKTAEESIGGIPGQGVGYKTANLQELENLTAKLNGTTASAGIHFTFHVPQFAAISSMKIKEFLKSKAIDLTTEWKSALPSQAEQLEILNQKKFFNDTFFNFLKTLEDRTAQIFKETSQNLLSPNFKSLFKLDNDQVDRVIEAVALKNQRLMVRSTGREDTEELANAGGNESVANVKPENKSVLENIGIVIASYFSKKSFTQRLKVDSRLFDEPLTPVLIQEMSGEQPGGSADEKDVPIVGVMFTEEPEGGIFNTTKTQTSGITIIQSSYGHNEGVVNGIVPVDTFYIDSNNLIHYVIREKFQRLVPSLDGTGTIGKQNPATLQTKQSLDDDAILALKYLANALEAHYQRPMDVEFVVNMQEKKIYLVQARPITYKSSLPDPWYLQPSFLTNIEQNKKLSCSTIGAAGGSVRFISSKDQVIIAHTLQEALSRYIDMTDTTHIQCIISEQPAPATSHEATTFRSEGIPVVQCSNKNQALLWIESNNVVIDVQNEVIVLWNNQPEKDVSSLKNNPNKVASGWLSYPMPLQGTIQIPSFFPAHFLTPHSMSLTTEASIISQYWKEFKDVSFKELVQIIKTNPEKNKARVALIKLLSKLLQYEVMLKKIQTQNPAAIDQSLITECKAINLCALAYAQKIKPLLTLPPSNSRRLFAIKLLEVLLFQQQTQGIIRPFSLAQTLMSTKWERKLTQELGSGAQANPMMIQFIKLGSSALTPELHEKLKAFTLSLKEKPLLQQELAQLIVKLASLKILPIWLHISFDELLKIGKPQETIDALAQEWNTSETFINTLQEKYKILTSLNISAWEDPAKFPKQFKYVKETIFDYFSTDEFIQNYKTTNNLGKIAALQVMKSFIDIIDNSIKAIKGSRFFSAKDKVKSIKQMLELNALLVRSWITLLSTEDLKNLQPADVEMNIPGTQEYLQTHPTEELKWLSIYLKDIDRRLTEIDPDLLSTEQLTQQLRGSGENFSVATVTLGSKIGYNKAVAPKVLEDMFTLLHQNLLALLSNLFGSAGIQSIKLPVILEQTKEHIDKLKKIALLPSFKFLRNISFIGAEFEQEQFTLHYNIPLRNHSCTIDLSYDRKHGEINTTAAFLFQFPDDDRMTNLKNYLTNKNLIQELSSDKRTLFYKAIIKQESDINALFTHIGKLTTLTIETE